MLDWNSGKQQQKKEVEKKILEKIFGKKIFEISWRGAVNQNLKKDG